MILVLSQLIISDINVGGILDLIKRNVELNKSYQRCPKNIEVLELNFLDNSFSVKLEDELKNIEVGVAADGK